MYIHMYVHIYMPTYIHIYKSAYIRIYIHTYIYIHTVAWRMQEWAKLKHHSIISGSDTKTVHTEQKQQHYEIIQSSSSSMYSYAWRTVFTCQCTSFSRAIIHICQQQSISLNQNFVSDLHEALRRYVTWPHHNQISLQYTPYSLTRTRHITTQHHE